MNDVNNFEIHVRNIRNIAEEMLAEHIGERCPDFDEDCIVCQKWQALDVLTENPYIDDED